MYFQYHGLNRTLSVDDLEGITALYPLASTPASPQPVTLFLEPGWTLTVLPAGPLDATMTSLACVDAVYAYNGATWDVWLRDFPPAIQRLTAAADAQAYWLHAATACAASFH